MWKRFLLRCLPRLYTVVIRLGNVKRWISRCWNKSTYTFMIIVIVSIITTFIRCGVNLGMSPDVNSFWELAMYLTPSPYYTIMAPLSLR